MAAVAAPRPDAEPVTIAYKPSFDIDFLTCFRASPSEVRDLPYQAADAKLRYAELMKRRPVACPSNRPPCGQRLSSLWLFPIIERKKKSHQDRIPSGVVAGRTHANFNIGERRGGE